MKQRRGQGELVRGTTILKGQGRLLMRVIFEQRPKQVREGTLQIFGAKANGKVLLTECAQKFESSKDQGWD